jgi:hypothetical protein
VNFAAGQTFLFPLSERHTAHLWVVATDPNPDGLILIVSLTSLNGSKDQTVILHGGEHPFIKWATCVAYNLADLMNCEVLEEHIQMGRAKRHADMRAEVVRLILDGFTASRFTKKRIQQFVRDYKKPISPERKAEG